MEIRFYHQGKLSGISRGKPEDEQKSKYAEKAEEGDSLRISGAGLAWYLFEGGKWVKTDLDEALKKIEKRQRDGR